MACVVAWQNSDRVSVWQIGMVAGGRPLAETASRWAFPIPQPFGLVWAPNRMDHHRRSGGRASGAGASTSPDQAAALAPCWSPGQQADTSARASPAACTRGRFLERRYRREHRRRRCRELIEAGPICADGYHWYFARNEECSRLDGGRRRRRLLAALPHRLRKQPANPLVSHHDRDRRRQSIAKRSQRQRQCRHRRNRHRLAGRPIHHHRPTGMRSKRRKMVSDTAWIISGLDRRWRRRRILYRASLIRSRSRGSIQVALIRRILPYDQSRPIIRRLVFNIFLQQAAHFEIRAPIEMTRCCHRLSPSTTLFTYSRWRHAPFVSRETGDQTASDYAAPIHLFDDALARVRISCEPTPRLRKSGCTLISPP